MCKQAALDSRKANIFAGIMQIYLRKLGVTGKSGCGAAEGSAGLVLHNRHKPIYIKGFEDT